MRVAKLRAGGSATAPPLFSRRQMSLSVATTSRPARAAASLMRSKSAEKARHSSSMIEAIKLKLHSDRGEGASPHGLSSPLLSQQLLEGYTEEELNEYRQVFNMFDADRSGAIAIDELEAAIKNLGVEQTRDDLDKIIDEVDQRGNHQIDFDEFCVVMRRLTMKKSTWNEVVRECFTVFDRSESGGISKKDFRFILRELGDITDNQVIDEIFNEADVDGNGVIDYDEFSYMVKNYMTDEDINA
ncbi:unnamed protein product [Caenorhabditis auriculariae]|uniref:EF-hand domain-containing protein n=1 Tax=Caenorhabditis auriculariae TaxID=2777116 RepID=A0A8S1H474_9PELO|nr:unnamed protein product [Caenorhabditis auriculariae]